MLTRPLTGTAGIEPAQYTTTFSRTFVIVQGATFAVFQSRLMFLQMTHTLSVHALTTYFERYASFYDIVCQRIIIITFMGEVGFEPTNSIENGFTVRRI